MTKEEKPFIIGVESKRWSRKESENRALESVEKAKMAETKDRTEREDGAILPSGRALAYYGDAVFEAMVRRRLLETGVNDPGRLNRFSLEFVTAGRQSEGAARLLPHLTEEEADFFRRGRNTVGRVHPKASTLAEYRAATGLETLFGALSLLGRRERLEELFSIAFPRTLFDELPGKSP